MPRLLFEKTGASIWISHLDLMRVFQRSFKRAGLHLTHTQGFNPRPSVSIALPLSVGVQSICELLDFDLDHGDVSSYEIRERLNRCLIPGVRVLDVYEDGKKLRDLAYLSCRINLSYDDGIPGNCCEMIRELFSRSALTVIKKSKSGPKEQDIIPMIRSIEVTPHGEHTVTIQAKICCQNPSLNPAQITQAITENLPQISPNHIQYQRLEIYDREENIFR